MKKNLFLFLVLTLVVACNQQDTNEQEGFVIDGTVAAFDSGYVYLKKVVDGELNDIDSALCVQGKFNLEGSVDFAEMFYLVFGDNKNMTNIFLDNSKITITANLDSLDKIDVTGSKAHDEFKQYQDEMKPFENKEKDLYSQYSEARKAGNEELLKQLEDTWETLSADKDNFIKSYIGTNNKSVVSPYILKRSNFFYTSPVKELDSLVSLLDSSLSNSVYYKDLKEKVEVLYSVDIGKTAPDFTLNDTIGTPITMSSFKGKYLLLDFWASWCGPCRQENPNNVALYNDYKDKGFEILGVSLDDEKEKWMKGIVDDGLTWPQVSDLKGWNAEAGKLYGVSSIPHTVLIDKEGVIIAKNLRGEELRTKIAELLD